MSRLAEALAKIDEVNARDPNLRQCGGELVAKELLYSQRMSAWLAKVEPGASDELQIACRAQHIARWNYPRSSYPEGRSGYKAWRAELLLFHARTTSEILVEFGFASPQIQQVSELLKKLHLGERADAQILEDVACLVFLEFELEAFLGKHERGKVIRVLRKTWGKMSDDAHQRALELESPALVAELLREALA